MSDSQRRLWCRLIFVLGCILPTGGIVYFGMHQPTTTDWEQTIQAYWGIATQIDTVETPEPGRTVLRGVHLQDADIQLESPIQQIEIYTWGSPKRLVVRQAIGVAGNSLAAVIDRFQNRLMSKTSTAANSLNEEWRVEFSQITMYQGELQSAAQPVVMQGLSLGWNQTDRGNSATLRFLLPESRDPQQFVEMSSNHQWDASGRSLTWILDTHQCFLPTWLVGSLIPELQDTGRNCHFQGLLKLQQAGANAQGEIQGRLTDVELQSWGATLKLPIRGVAQAVIAGKMVNGQLQEFDCRLATQQGSANRHWLAQLTQMIGAEWTQPLVEDTVLFSSALLDFKVRDGLLHFEPDAFQLLSMKNEHLVSMAAQPVAGLEDAVKRLASQSEPSEQLTNAMVHLLGRFHLPPITREARESAGDIYR